MKRRGRLVLLSGISYELGQLRSVSTTASEGEAKEAAQILIANGVSSYSQLDERLIEVAKRNIRKALWRAKRRAADVDAVLVVTESFTEFSGNTTRLAQGTFQQARNAIFDAVADVGVRVAPVFCSTFGGSSNFLQAIFIAKPMVESGAVDCLLIVCADKRGADESRFMYDAVALVGDGVAACVLSRQSKARAGAYEVEYAQIAPFTDARNPGHLQRMLLDMYKTTKAVAAECYERTRRQPGRFGWLLLSNYNVPSNRVFSRILGFSEERTYMRNVGRTGHIPSCDHLVNLRDLAADVCLKSGTSLLLFLNGPISCGAISLIVR
jgi:3-oxoacyl-[acyl-carrier-protein] synthase III